jgi:ribosomal protein S18 acetylase RimI-like enzyme
MEYRKAELSDIEALSQMRLAMLREEGDFSEAFKAQLLENTKTYIENGIKDDSFVTWIAEEDGELAAMGGVCFFTLPPNDWCPGGKSAYIGNMYTAPAFRKRGIASRLLELVLDEAKSRGCERIWLHTTGAGKRLYEKYSFETLDTAMGLYPYGINPSV